MGFLLNFFYSVWTLCWKGVCMLCCLTNKYSFVRILNCVTQLFIPLTLYKHIQDMWFAPCLSLFFFKPEGRRWWWWGVIYVWSGDVSLRFSQAVFIEHVGFNSGKTTPNIWNTQILKFLIDFVFCTLSTKRVIWFKQNQGGFI